MSRAVVAVIAALALAAPASAQVTARAPEWARALLVTEADAVNVRQSALAAPEGAIVARLAIAPAQGGVARLVRFEATPSGGSLALRRFTGHNRNGWVLWGAEQAVPVVLDPVRRAQIERLARAALAAGALGGENSAPASIACTSGDYAWLEVADGSRSVTFERRCAMDGASGALIRALSDAAGNKDEEQVFQAGIAEVMAAEAAFAKQAREEGLAAAAATWAAEDGREFPGGATVLEGRQALAQHYQGADPGTPLQWTPGGADVSARGDMAWSWGRWNRAEASGNYVAVWRRDADGVWRYAARILN